MSQRVPGSYISRADAGTVVAADSTLGIHAICRCPVLSRVLKSLTEASSRRRWPSCLMNEYYIYRLLGAYCRVLLLFFALFG